MATYKTTKARDLRTLDVIKDPEGNETIVRRVHLINHERARLTTDALVWPWSGSTRRSPSSSSLAGHAQGPSRSFNESGGLASGLRRGGQAG